MNAQEFNRAAEAIATYQRHIQALLREKTAWGRNELTHLLEVVKTAVYKELHAK